MQFYPNKHPPYETKQCTQEYYNPNPVGVEE
jgi:hypothetical protein